ncbi:hypothetical protein Ahy_B01g053687 [Arachis hypogaea]|uniref:Ribonuclease H1 N-terminal domain-containing protein n=1 Tax=Arachis hypogaea TaxID=3818 RepID=A0A445AS98_ARAHY|nr:hypothetical protein Ahy_B01g053687 [Arachis hypogaea]
MSTEAGCFPVYVVRRGRVPGVYRTWKECNQQVNGYRNCEYRGFQDLDEGLAWLRSAATPSTRQPAHAVQPNDRGLDLVAHGPLCYEKRFACQEVSFTMVEKILFATGYTVSDYNYRILGCVTEQLKTKILGDKLKCLEKYWTNRLHVIVFVYLVLVLISSFVLSRWKTCILLVVTEYCAGVLVGLYG